ncbi:hypothetical protein EPH95_15210 [Salicibibacter halophilus]|uniref:Uncharacterized protein n=1 Tax=Salicibibacter halophilus TaxID=2502791 RepID=A0A514LKL6_9BACI|nr:hypothetical protein [Salicibibacter halophilus]QDI92372.1 hypothetical protein EPH95_15210 [Salicibibacter halophilus]
MSHDICGFNKAGNEICHIRFTMGDSNALIVYELFNASDYYAGVSGNGHSKEVSLPEAEKAMTGLNQLHRDNEPHDPNNEYLVYLRRELDNFFMSCLDTAQKEGSVRVSFA